MKIADLQVDGFGVWKGLTIDAFSENMTLFYGQNEAGKTTLMQFVRSMLFGFSPLRRERYVPPVYGGLAGGSMAVSSPLGGFEIQRHVDHNRLNDPTGDLAVTDAADGSVHGRAQLGSILSDVDESIFNNVFAIGLKEIQELGALNSTAAAEHLYKLTSGLDRVSLVDVMRTLTKRREAIWSTDGEVRSRMTELFSKRLELIAEIEELSTRSRRWSKIAVQTNDVSRQLDEVEQQIRERQDEGRVVEIAMQLSDRWRNREMVDQQLNELGRLPDKRDLDLQKLDQVNEKISLQRQRFDELRRQRREVRNEALDLPINRQLWAQTPKIQALNEHLPWIDSLQRQSDRLHQEMDAIRKNLGGEITGLGTQLKLDRHEVKDIANRGLIGIRAAAKRMVAETEKQAELQGKVEQAEYELNEHTSRLRGSQAESDGLLNGTIDEAGKTVTRLRRRVELENKIDKLNRARRDLERELDDVISDQVLPVGKLTIVGAVFIAGVVLFGMGILWSGLTGSAIATGMRDMGLLFLILGFGVGLFAIGLKHHWDRIARDEFNDYQHQFDLIRQQIKRAKSERDEIERQLPKHTSGQWELDLKDAESSLTKMEEIVPLENRIKAAKRELENTKREMQKQMIEVEAAEARWREALRSMGLPETMSPTNLDEVTQRTEKITGFQTRLEQYNHELSERDKELININRKIEAVLEQAGLELSLDDSPADRLHQLTTALAEQSRLVARRKELAARFRTMRNKLTKTTLEVDRLLGVKQKLLSHVGAENESEFRVLYSKLSEKQKLLEKRLQLTDQIAAALGKSITEEQVGNQLENYGQGGLEKRWELLQEEVEELRVRETKLHQQRGELLQEVKMLGEDSRLDEARLELNCLDTELEDLKQQWRVLACSSHVLESIRENYEAQRQPETLKEASGFLKRLTDGHYDRIWTRLVGEELLVDNHEGETLSVENLSRGTREAVYLALRLALVGAYARRGAVLPMVLDDVLVNFDSKRARSAATVLRDFANSGYQILMFTCHDHIRDLFHDLQVDVRVLPHHKDVVETNAVPTRYEPTDQIYLPPPTQPSIEPAVVRQPAAVGEVTVVPGQEIGLTTDEFDPELEYELSAISKDQANSYPNDAPFDPQHFTADGFPRADVSDIDERQSA